jgi:hypothetical protein
VEDAQGLGDIQEVRYEISKTGAGSSVKQGELVDDGTSGDIIPKDGVYSNQIDGSFAQNDTGDFNLKVFAKDASGNLSNSLLATFKVLSGTENLPPEIMDVVAPETVPIDSSFDFVVAAGVKDPEGLADIQKVVLQFFPPAHPTPILERQLLDNGDSGDEIAGDGTFSAILPSNLIKETKDHFIRLQAEDKAGNVSQAVVVSIRGRFKIVGAPVISKISAPDIVNAKEKNQVLITAEVSDPQGLSDIDTVQFRIFLPDGQEAENSPQVMADDGNTTLSGDLVAGDGIFSSVLQLPTAGVAPIDFKLVFQAQDKSNSFSAPVEHVLTIAFDNAPVISNLVAPDRVKINPTQTTKILLTIRVKDPQGLADIDTVQFRSFLPSGQEANNSPIQLFDDGKVDESGDVRAGDGTYSRNIFLPSQGVTPGDFKFIFRAKDKSGLVSNTIEHILTVVE